MIGAMLRLALTRLIHDDFRIFVGTYPNDPRTQAEVRTVEDPRVLLVDGTAPGPTTKAECLNRCWRALLEDEGGTGVRYKAVLLHDAEDLVHPLDLRVVDSCIEQVDMIQLPVLPLIDRGAAFVSGHYADEFAEVHGRQLPVREALGAGIPAAGVGCALSRTILGRIAAEGGGDPFDPSSLTEDYEIGLRLCGLDAKGSFIALPSAPGEPLVAVRAYFPATLSAAVRQKTRWMIGIACAGWDRLGWTGDLAERWMRLRDRKAILAALVLFASYLALVLLLLCRSLSVPLEWPSWFHRAVPITTFLLVWRLAIRGMTVARVYGWREGLMSIPRLITANIILMMAARRAMRVYVPGIVPAWDKTTHRVPDAAPCD